MKPYPNYTDADWDALRKKTACQYTSDAFRRAELTLLEKGEQLAPMFFGNPSSATCAVGYLVRGLRSVRLVQSSPRWRRG